MACRGEFVIVPQGLRPVSLLGLCGTAEAVPFPEQPPGGVAGSPPSTRWQVDGEEKDNLEAPGFMRYIATVCYIFK